MYCAGAVERPLLCPAGALGATRAIPVCVPGRALGCCLAPYPSPFPKEPYGWTSWRHGWTAIWLWYSGFPVIPLRNPSEAARISNSEGQLPSRSRRWQKRREQQAPSGRWWSGGISVPKAMLVLSLETHRTSKIVALCCVLAGSRLYWQAWGGTIMKTSVWLVLL